MRLFLLAAAACIAAPAAAQQQQPAPARALTPEQRANGEALLRARALFLIDRAAQVTTRDMLVRVADPAAAGIIGWIGQPEGNAIAVTYFAREGDGYAAVYRGRLSGTRVVSPEVFAAGSRPRLEGVAARMAAARVAVDALDHAPCGADSLNTIVLPPQGREDPILVYEISPRIAADRIPGGGHYRTVVAPNGSVGESTPLAPGCRDLALAGTGPLALDGGDVARPNEAHVFLSLWSGRPLAVATTGGGAKRWNVTPNSISELQQ